MSSKASAASTAWLEVLQHPGAFALRVLRAFRKNQGLLLAGAVAYYALLSIVPLLILIVIALSHVLDQALLLETLERYLGWVVPGQSQPIIDELAGFLRHRDVLGWVLAGTLLFFSSLAFTVLENAMSIIFFHRVAVRRRHFLVSAIIPYCYILFLGVGLLVVTLVAAGLEVIGQGTIEFLGRVLGEVGHPHVADLVLRIDEEVPPAAGEVEPPLDAGDLDRLAANVVILDLPFRAADGQRHVRAPRPGDRLDRLV